MTEKFSGCPGSQALQFADNTGAHTDDSGARPSRLQQWPVQLALLSPQAPYFQHAEVLLAADCVAYAVGDFHKYHLAGHSLAIACPKLDGDLESYRAKLTALIDQAQIERLTVIIMEVPCCRALVRLAQSALEQATRKIPLGCKVVGIRGNIVSEGPC